MNKIFFCDYYFLKRQINSKKARIKSKIYTIALLVILVIGSISSIAEFYISLGNMSLEFIVGKTKYTLEEYANRNLNIPDDEKYNYYTYDLDSSIFYKFLVKEQINE